MKKFIICKWGKPAGAVFENEYKKTFPTISGDKSKLKWRSAKNKDVIDIVFELNFRVSTGNRDELHKYIKSFICQLGNVQKQKYHETTGRFCFFLLYWLHRFLVH